ncbi:MAG: HAD family hydrolase [Myxococcota bacterium]|jgi:phosphoglycolate phosphatase-like HAD superfamily hydrolase|nr:HAD family hydrolase [Myxococcota bacterium]
MSDAGEDRPRPGSAAGPAARPPTRLLLFDVDGTLVQCGGIGLRSLLRTAARWADRPVAERLGLAADGMTDPVLAAQALQEARGHGPADQAELQRFLAEYEAELAAGLQGAHGYRVLPGVRPLLEALSQRPGLGIGLGTGNTERGARLKLGRGELHPFFTFGGYGSDSADRAELLARGRQRGEQVLGEAVDPRAVVVVGDTVRDIAAARANGFCVVAVATGSSSVQTLAAAAPDQVLESLTDLGSSLAALLGDPSPPQAN